MPSFCAADGTELAYHVQGAPLVCLPGGPGRASSYLGDLGGLSAHRRLILLDSRGTGRSAIPADPASYRCGHLVEDVAPCRIIFASTVSTCWATQLRQRRRTVRGAAAGAGGQARPDHGGLA
jgi:pimeloyl-ACP methyl ester carboxylesterase